MRPQGQLSRHSIAISFMTLDDYRGLDDTHGVVSGMALQGCSRVLLQLRAGANRPPPWVRRTGAEVGDVLKEAHIIAAVISVGQLFQTLRGAGDLSFGHCTKR